MLVAHFPPSPALGLPRTAPAMTGPFDEKLARTYFHKFISGLNACHAANVVHRDMKPENLLLNDAFDIKLADFGLAAAIAVDGAMRTTRCGTESYMSPELLSLHHGQSYDGKAVDVFASGCILFIMLVGGMALFGAFVVRMTCLWYFIQTLFTISDPCPWIVLRSAAVRSRLDGRLVVLQAGQRPSRRVLGRARAAGGGSRSAARAVCRGQAAAAVHAVPRPGAAHHGAGHSRQCLYLWRAIRVRL